MWFFNSPEIVFGEDALAYLENLEGRRAMIVTDCTLVRLGYAAQVRAVLETAGLGVKVFDAVEPEPSVETVKAGALALQDFGPDWIVGLGGGSALDAAKAMWVLYERPDIEPEGINPIDKINLRQKARFIAIPTTSGTGSEATWAIVLTHTAERRKMGLGSRETLPDMAILDPALVMGMPPRLTADTGLDALTHAVEGFTGQWHNDFSDGMCLKAAQLVFQYLRRAYRNGSDAEARQRMQNAACIAGLGFGNSMAALAHGLGHALGAVFHIPHGRAVILALPYTIEYCVRGEPGSTRYAELARFLELPHGSEFEAASALAQAIRVLQRDLISPCSLVECGVTRAMLEGELTLLVDNASNDTQTVTSTRIPDTEEMKRLFRAMQAGEAIDF
jgi:alcohol dehydrogenase class IV